MIAYKLCSTFSVIISFQEPPGFASINGKTKLRGYDKNSLNYMKGRNTKMEAFNAGPMMLSPNEFHIISVIAIAYYQVLNGNLIVFIAVVPIILRNSISELLITIPIKVITPRLMCSIM